MHYEEKYYRIPQPTGGVLIPPLKLWLGLPFSPQRGSVPAMSLTPTYSSKITGLYAIDSLHQRLDQSEIYVTSNMILVQALQI